MIDNCAEYRRIIEGGIEKRQCVIGYDTGCGGVSLGCVHRDRYVSRRGIPISQITFPDSVDSVRYQPPNYAQLFHSPNLTEEQWLNLDFIEPPIYSVKSYKML